jgi:hypothetical protein
VAPRSPDVPVEGEKGYDLAMKSLLRLLSASFLLIGVASACDFYVQPAALPHYYRARGWKLPECRPLEVFGAC